MLVIACLGNPGKEYERTRHNVGFRFADLLVEKLGILGGTQKFKSDVFKGTWRRAAGEAAEVLILKPLTYMNLSGEAISAACRFYKLPPSLVTVVYDDFDIPFGTIRYRDKGSAGTHNGMKSAVAHLKTTEFPRLRIGIGPKPEGADVSDFVLSNFSSSEEKELPNLLDQAVLELERRIP